MNENNVIPYDFRGNNVRVVTLDGEPWFVVADVCRVLGLSNPTIAVGRVDSTEKAKASLGYGLPVNVVSESGLYKLIMRSDKPEARVFQDWVTREVLPTIRKTGGYMLKGADRATIGEGEMETLPDPLKLADQFEVWGDEAKHHAENMRAAYAFMQKVQA